MNSVCQEYLNLSKIRLLIKQTHGRGTRLAGHHAGSVMTMAVAAALKGRYAPLGLKSAAALVLDGGIPIPI